MQARQALHTRISLIHPKATASLSGLGQRFLTGLGQLDMVSIQRYIVAPSEGVLL